MLRPLLCLLLLLAGTLPAEDPTGHNLTPEQTQARLNRTPIDVAQELSAHYGHHLKTVMYQPALSLVARMQLGELTSDPSHLEDVGKILQPYCFTDPSTPLPAKANGSQISGHLAFAEYAHRAPASLRPAYVGLVQRAADRAFNADGSPREAMPSHNEMSDAVFMGTPILVAAGRLTGDAKYLEMAVIHLAFMQNHCLRDDGIYRHSPLCEAAWGRGNGFPALGLTLCLTDLDAILKDDKSAQPLKVAARKAYDIMLPAYRAHMAALRPYQDDAGMWHQVIDHPAAYQEMTSTCMITFAMARGLQTGWLDSGYRPTVDRAWEAIKLRIGSDGSIAGVCVGTGKLKTLQEYLDRPKTFTRDERGGAMAFLAAIEIARLIGVQR